MSASEFLTSPFHRFLQIEVLRMEEGLAEIRLPLRPELLRQEGSDWLHGGIVAALIDIAGNAAIRSVAGAGLPTIDLRVDYLRPSRSEITASAKAVKVGKTIGIADIEVRDRARNLVAIGRAVYSLPGSPAEPARS
jgi:uncharacterized protein (TIGR00369 family)